MKTQLLYKYKCFSLIFTGFFSFDINKKRTIYEKTQNTTVHLQCVCCNIKQRTKGTCIILIQYLYTTRKLYIKGTMNENIYQTAQASAIMPLKA